MNMQNLAALAAIASNGNGALPSLAGSGESTVLFLFVFPTYFALQSALLGMPSHVAPFLAVPRRTRIHCPRRSIRVSPIDSLVSVFFFSRCLVLVPSCVVPATLPARCLPSVAGAAFAAGDVIVTGSPAGHWAPVVGESFCHLCSRACAGTAAPPGREIGSHLSSSRRREDRCVCACVCV